MVWANDEMESDITDQERTALTIEDAKNKLGKQATNLEITELYSDEGGWPLIKLDWLGTESELANKLVEIKYIDEPNEMKYLLNFAEKLEA